jgi:hypothetical protein
MCLLGIAFCQFSELPLLVLANREEYYARPAAGPRLFPRDGELPAWFGGTDLVAGGTWLGVNEFGLLVAVTNRKKQRPPENPPSRGLLCRSLLAFRETASTAASAERELSDNRYAGCNVLIADRGSAIVIEAGDVRQSTRLDPGLHLIANAALNDDGDPRIRRVRKEFDRVRGLGIDAWFDDARRVCPLPAEGNEPPICLTGPDRGTVSSTILGIGSDPANARYWYSAGPPNVTPYEDYGPLFRDMLSRSAGHAIFEIEPPDDSPARRAVKQSLTHRTKDGEKSTPAAQSPPAAEDARAGNREDSAYRIFLRGPWQSEPLVRAGRDAEGKLVWTDTGLPRAATARLPASWQDLFSDFRGRIRFRRRFHPPSSIEPGDRLFVVFDGVGGTGPVALNGHSLGRIEATTGPARFEVTGLLQVNNELVVDLEFTDSGAAAEPGGLFETVALEIRSHR